MLPGTPNSLATPVAVMMEQRMMTANTVALNLGGASDLFSVINSRVSVMGRLYMPVKNRIKVDATGVSMSSRTP